MIKEKRMQRLMRILTPGDSMKFGRNEISRFSLTRQHLHHLMDRANTALKVRYLPAALPPYLFWRLRPGTLRPTFSSGLPFSGSPILGESDHNLFKATLCNGYAMGQKGMNSREGIGPMYSF
jgi:hypothetical protein